MPRIFCITIKNSFCLLEYFDLVFLKTMSSLISKDKELNKSTNTVPLFQCKITLCIMKVLIGLLILALTAYECSAKPTKLTGEQCHGTACPDGCCPEVNWFCCQDWYCARIPEDCPIVAARKSLIKLAAPTKCEGTECPGGCCPEYNWVCCPEFLCAATADDCIRTAVTTRKSLIKMAAQKDCEGTMCPGGCCPEVNWYCCPEWYCAATADDCVRLAARKSLIKMAATKGL